MVIFVCICSQDERISSESVKEVGGKTKTTQLHRRQIRLKSVINLRQLVEQNMLAGKVYCVPV